MNKKWIVLFIALLTITTLHAQMITPQQSPFAVTTQRIGITDITVTYHRPAVKERDIWNSNVVQFDGQPFPWRAGANDNTLFKTTHDLLIAGKPLPAGEYGIHIIPKKEGKWIVIFSKNTTSWGSFRYDAKEDVLRAEVNPVTIAHQESLMYHFTDLKKDGAVLSLDWEKKRIPVAFKVDNMDEVVLAYYDKMLQGSTGFTWRGWFDKALYCEMNETHLDEGLIAVDQSIRRVAKWDNYTLKESILRKLGKAAEADKIAHDRVYKIADGNALNNYGYSLITQKKHEEALEIFKLNVKKNPDEPNFYDSLGECYKIMGDTKNAIKNYRKALSMNPLPFVRDNAIKMLEELGVKYEG